MLISEEVTLNPNLLACALKFDFARLIIVQMLDKWPLDQTVINKNKHVGLKKGMTTHKTTFIFFKVMEDVFRGLNPKVSEFVFKYPKAYIHTKVLTMISS